MPDTAAREADAPDTKANARRSTLLLLLGLLVVLGAVGYGIYWFSYASHFVSTDNAYVNADTAEITPLAGGPVARVFVRETQQVNAGDILVRVTAAGLPGSPKTYTVTLAAADSNDVVAGKIQAVLAGDTEVEVTRRVHDLDEDHDRRQPGEDQSENREDADRRAPHPDTVADRHRQAHAGDDEGAQEQASVGAAEGLPGIDVEIETERAGVDADSADLICDRAADAVPGQEHKSDQRDGAHDLGDPAGQDRPRYWPELLHARNSRNGAGQDSAAASWKCAGPGPTAEREPGPSLASATRSSSPRSARGR